MIDRLPTRTTFGCREMHVGARDLEFGTSPPDRCRRMMGVRPGRCTHRAGHQGWVLHTGVPLFAGWWDVSRPPHDRRAGDASMTAVRKTNAPCFTLVTPFRSALGGRMAPTRLPLPARHLLSIQRRARRIQDPELRKYELYDIQLASRRFGWRRRGDGVDSRCPREVHSEPEPVRDGV